MPKLTEDIQRRDLMTIYVIGSIIVTLIVLMLTCANAGADSVKTETISSCLDPRNLPDNLKKSYEALKKSGHDVRVNCYPKQPGLTKEQLKAIESLRQ